MSNLDEEIENTEKKIQELTEQLGQLREAKKKKLKTQKRESAMYDDPRVNLIVAFVHHNPGCDKRDIAEFTQIDGKELTDILTKARRNRGFLENRGTRHQPKWFIK